MDYFNKPGSSMQSTNYNPLMQAKALTLSFKENKELLSKLFVEGTSNPTDDDYKLEDEKSSVDKEMLDFLQKLEHPKLVYAYRDKIYEAYQNRRIFMVQGYQSTVLRHALKARGWLEKIDPAYYPHLYHLSHKELLENAEPGNDYETVAISKAIRKLPAFFIWEWNKDGCAYADVFPYRNHVQRGNALDFTWKGGLLYCTRHLHWHTDCGTMHSCVPRFYCILTSHEERLALIEDYRRTMCLGLMRYVCDHFDNRKRAIVDARNGRISPEHLEFAYKYMQQIMRDLNGCVSTMAIRTDPRETAAWREMKHAAQQIVCYGAAFKASRAEIQGLVLASRKYFQELEEICPEYSWDGYRNLWIVKPARSYGGQGVEVLSDMQQILRTISRPTDKGYIVQKYVELPLLIYGTKFDIRQYALLVIREKLTSIWLYNDCYLKFSNRPFTLEDLSGVVHVTNHTVQKYYRPARSRDARLPKYNMWSLSQLLEYLRQENCSQDQWLRIFEGFQRCIVSMMVASFEETNFVKNRFELFGCDFLLDQNYKPILLEVNASPDLSASTPVTANLCPRVLSDLVKVVVDYDADKEAATGGFVKAYEINHQTFVKKEEFGKLKVKGKAMHLQKKSKQVK